MKEQPDIETPPEDTLLFARHDVPVKVLEAFRNVQRECTDGYAKVYADDDALKEALEMGGLNALKIQANYVLSNTAHWRGDLARATKKTLREFTKRS